MNSEVASSYMALRQAKIARNEARLRELGLLRYPPPRTARSVVTPNKKTSSSKKKKRTNTPIPPTRRSTRLRKAFSRGHDHKESVALKQPTSEKKMDPNIASTMMVKARTSQPLDRAQVIQALAAARKTTPEPPVTLPVQNSARAMALDLPKLLFESMPNFVGGEMEGTGKRHVMEYCARMGGADDCGAAISFNKYSGIQEWKNCFFLWINLGATDRVQNEFRQPRHVSWFGGSKMHHQTPVIQRLLQQTAADTNNSSGCDAVILFCRLYDGSGKKFRPYRCLGRLRLESYDPEKSPLAFWWELVDYDRLWNHPDESIQSYFRQLF